MTRQIKFRGKNKTGQWVIGYYVQHPTGTSFIVRYATSGSPEWHEVDPVTVEESTRLQDRNGKTIFEGDIVEIVSYFTHPRDKVFARTEALVEFRKGEVVATRGTATYSIYNFLEDVEIIGNMHDINPEMLKGGEK